MQVTSKHPYLWSLVGPSPRQRTLCMDTNLTVDATPAASARLRSFMVEDSATSNSSNLSVSNHGDSRNNFASQSSKLPGS